MLCECNLLSRYNQHIEAIRREEQAAVLARNARIEQKIGAKLTALVTCTDSLRGDVVVFGVYATMMKDFRHSLESYSCHPGFSNQVVSCVGNTVS